MLQGFLWILFGVVTAALGANTVMLGSSAFTSQALLPNLLLLAVIWLAIWLNRRGGFKLAATLVVGTKVLLTSLIPLLSGVAGNEVSLFLLFSPLVLAGLVLGRRALYLTATWCVLAVLLAPALNGTGLLLLADPDIEPAWISALQFALVVVTVTFFLDRFGLTFQSTMRRAVEQEMELNREMAERLETRERLVEEERFSNAIIQSLPGLFYVRDEEGYYRQWNRRFIEVLGYTENEVRDLHPLALFEGEERDLVKGRIEDVFRQGSATAEVTLVTKDSKRLPYLLSASRVSLGGSKVLVGVGIDRSQLEAAQRSVQALNEDLQVQVERLSALREIDRAIIGSLDLNLTLDVVLEQVRSRLRVDAACVLLYEPNRNQLVHGASQGLRGKGLHRTRLRLGEGLAGEAALQRQTMLAASREEFMTEFGHSADVAEEEFEFYMAVPLVAKGKLQGVLELFHRSPVEPDADRLDFLEALTAQTAIALDGAALFEDLEQKNKQLLLAYDTTIEGWAKALEIRDHETEGHSRRVTAMSIALGKALGLEDEAIVSLRRGALLHDIGKMAVPDSILHKPGTLTSDEWTVMETHTIHAKEFLSQIPFLEDATDVPYCHHEKWDGTGYPRGLAGEEIPLTARVFAVVDVYDALTSDRPYRKAWTKEAALAHIQDQSGKHFDPAVVAAFKDLLASQLIKETRTVAA